MGEGCIREAGGMARYGNSYCDCGLTACLVRDRRNRFEKFSNSAPQDPNAGGSSRAHFEIHFNVRYIVQIAHIL